MRKARDAGRKRAAHVGVDQRHLGRFVEVLVVHVVNEVERIHIDAGEPVHHDFVLRHHFLVVQDVARDGTVGGRDLRAGLFIHAAVDCVQKALREVGARAEELHLLAGFGGGHAAADGVVVAPHRTHHVVVFILHGRGGDGNLRGVAAERDGQRLRVEHREIGLGRGPHVFQRVQEAEVVLRHHGAAVHADAAHFQGRPHRVAREELVVGRDARELHHAELQDEVVNELLRLRFRERSFLQVALNVDVKERGDAAHAHRGAVLGLHRGEVAEVEPLHSLAGVLRGHRDVKAVGGRHLLHVVQGAHLVGELFALADDVFGHDAAAAVQMILLLLRQEVVNAVERHAAVVAHDAAAAVRVGKPRDDLVLSDRAHLRRVGVVDRLVVRLAVFVEDLLELRVGRVAVGRAGFLRHADAAVRHEGALQGLVRLKAHDLLEVLQGGINVGRRIRRDGRDHFGLDV